MILLASDLYYALWPIYFNHIENPDTYKFRDDKKTEILKYDGGFIISFTSPTINSIDIYNPETDSIVKGIGYKRNSRFFVYTNSFPFIKIDYTLKKTIPLSTI
jgi:hypothetical protein